MDPPRKLQRLRTVYELGHAFAARLELDELLPFVVDKCRELLDAEGVSVMLLDEERREFYFPFMSEDDPNVAGRLAGLRFPASAGIAGETLRTARAMKVDDVSAEPLFYPGVDRDTKTATRALIAAPLATTGAAFGVIEAVNPRAHATFTDDDLDLFEALAQSIAVAIDNARRFGKVKDSEQNLRVQVGALRSDLARRKLFTEIVGGTSGMAEIFQLIESAAASEINVLIQGETGTGKELVARAIHRASARANGPFLAVNCTALAEQLLESTLFGHRRGSFTGATRDQQGLFHAADGGVIFLDEVGEMPLPMQAKLLRVLQEREVIAVGDTRAQRVDVRVISAANRDVKAAVGDARFRADLYYRLAAFPIRIPPLRERKEDIPLLADHFLDHASRRTRKRIPGIEPSAMNLLARLEWPGNVRELQNEIERAVAVARDGESIALGHFSSELGSSAPATSGGRIDSGAPATAQTDSPADSLAGARALFEADYIRSLLRSNRGNVSHTAEALGISRVALQRKMKRYRLR